MLLCAGPTTAEPERRRLALFVTSGTSGHIVDEDGSATIAGLVATVNTFVGAVVAQVITRKHCPWQMLTAVTLYTDTFAEAPT